MAQNVSTEDRLIILEDKMTELESQRGKQEDRDVALLARVDNLTDDLRQMERVQLHGFDELRAGQSNLRAVQHAQEEYLTARINDVEEHLIARIDTVEDHLTALTEAVVSHREIIEAIYAGQQALQASQRTLQAGQQQIFELLAGKPRFRTHD